MRNVKIHTHTHTHTHTRLTALCPGLPGWAGTRKVKPIWILLKQETMSRSGISWAVYKSAPRSRQITTPAPPPLRFLQAGCPSCRPTNSVKALKAVVKVHVRNVLRQLQCRLAVSCAIPWLQCQSLADQDRPTPPRRAAAALPRVLDLYVVVNTVLQNPPPNIVDGI